jgi:hypothetical protein
MPNDDKVTGIRRKREFEAARNMGSGGDGRPILVKESVFQLVPGVSSSACSGVKQAVWRNGYWHIARSQVGCDLAGFFSLTHTTHKAHGA